jgi:hypothetical protein
VLDEMFRAIVEATIGPAARAKACEANAVWSPAMDLAGWLREALAAPEGPWGAFHARHQHLRGRLEKGLTTRPAEKIRRKDLDRLYPEGYEILEQDGVLAGQAKREGADREVLGLVGTTPVGAERAWRFAQAAPFRSG